MRHYQLSKTQSEMWLHGGSFRQRVATHIVSKYPEGAAVVEFYGRVIAMVAPNGSVRELSPPFKRMHRNQISISPRPQQCACANFFDPEVGGPWKLRPGVEHRHHPFCEFNLTSHRVFDAITTAIQCQGSVRPDEHLREEERQLGLRGEKTGARRG